MIEINLFLHAPPGLTIKELDEWIERIDAARCRLGLRCPRHASGMIRESMLEDQSRRPAHGAEKPRLDEIEMRVR